jgi:hypothetical protein
MYGYLPGQNKEKPTRFNSITGAEIGQELDTLPWASWLCGDHRNLLFGYPAKTSGNSF